MLIEEVPIHIRESLQEKNNGLPWTKEGIYQREETKNYFIPDPDGFATRKDFEILMRNPKFVGVTFWKSGQSNTVMIYIFKE